MLLFSFACFSLNDYGMTMGLLLDVHRASSDSAIHTSVTTTSASHLTGCGSMLLSNGPSM